MAKSMFMKSAWRKVKALKPGKYFRELSVVIIGVAVTFYLSGLIGQSKERTDTELYIDAIRNELQYNLSAVDSLSAYYTKHMTLRRLLLSYSESPRKSTKDSINMYSKVYNSTNSFYYNKAAYEMFINSGMMKNLSNKQLLLDITESYIKLETLYSEHNMHTDLKFRQFSDLYSQIDLSNTKEDVTILDESMRGLYNFHALNSGLLDLTIKAHDQIEKTLAQP